MRYTLLLHYPEMTAEDLGQEAWDEGKAAFHAYAEALDGAGVAISLTRCRPTASRRGVRHGTLNPTGAWADRRFRPAPGPHRRTVSPTLT